MTEKTLNILLTPAVKLDKWIFDKLKIELKHNYHYAKYYPCADYWKTKKDSESINKDGTFIWVMKDKDKVVMDYGVYGANEEIINKVDVEFLENVQHYAAMHLYFSLSTWLFDKYKEQSFKKHPCCMIGNDGKWYLCKEKN